jgi:nucleoside-diphosphate-sugar epimerase
MIMKILVAGGAGYIGSRLVPALLDRGYEVSVIDLLWFGNHLPPEVRVERKDLFQCTPADLEGYEQLVFLAGLSNDPMAEFNPSQNFVQNGGLPAYLAFIAKQAGVRRMVYASSCSVYGYTVDRLYDEESPVTCSYPYGISKLQGERAVMQLHDDRFSVLSLRQGTVCGYSPRMRFDLIVNTMFKTALEQGKIVVNNPSIWRPILDIRDTVSAFLRAIQANYTVSGTFNVASGNFTVGQVADLVKEELETVLDSKVRLELRNATDYRNYKVTWEKAKVELGFLPQYSIRDIVRELVHHRDVYGDLNQEVYSNIAVFKKIAGSGGPRGSGQTE